MGRGSQSRSENTFISVILGLMGGVCDNQSCLSLQDDRKKTKEVKKTPIKGIWVARNYCKDRTTDDTMAGIIFRCVSISISAKFTDRQTNKQTHTYLALYDFVWLCMSVYDFV